MVGRYFCRRLKARIKYYFAKLLVLILALNILDISIDVDFTASAMPLFIKSYNDIDSVSGYNFEKIFDNDNLFGGSENDEQQQGSSRAFSGYSSAFYYIPVKNEFVAPAIISLSTPLTYALKNVTLFFEGHFRRLYISQDRSMCLINPVTNMTKLICAFDVINQFLN